ncbi:transcriptional regulator, RpiR family [Klebsiella pneumoniae IS46]|nr:transcriptional regulator, RpiR family [Klebsiella pneumoniae IS46]
MDVENIFRDVKLSKTEMTVLRFIQNDPEQCIRQGVRAVAEQCYSNPSSLVRLAKKLKFSGWLELVYFIKFNITMPKLDVTNDIDYMSVQPEEALTPLLASLKQQRILIHGSGFSQLIAQYIYNKFLVTGVNASLALWPDYEILEQKKTPPASTPSGSFLNPGAAARRSTGLRPWRGRRLIWSALPATTKARWRRPRIRRLLFTTRRSSMMIFTGATRFSATAS